jgi:hypothetical protein
MDSRRSSHVKNARRWIGQITAKNLLDSQQFQLRETMSDTVLLLDLLIVADHCAVDGPHEQQRYETE